MTGQDKPDVPERSTDQDAHSDGGSWVRPPDVPTVAIDVPPDSALSDRAREAVDAVVREIQAHPGRLEAETKCAKIINSECATLIYCKISG